MNEITVLELKSKIDKGDDFQLIDVREDNEREFANIGGDHILMNSIAQNIDKISKTKEVVIYCRSGIRSARVAIFLENNHGFNKIYNLTGGILAWADQVDNTIKKY